MALDGEGRGAAAKVTGYAELNVRFFAYAIALATELRVQSGEAYSYEKRETRQHAERADREGDIKDFVQRRGYQAFQCQSNMRRNSKTASSVFMKPES